MTVILTRPANRNESLALRLQQAGVPVRLAPALQIVERDAPRPEPCPGELFVFVSRQAVEAYFSRINVAWPKDCWATAVGIATAQALLAHVPADQILQPAVGASPDSESLLASIRKQKLTPARAHVLRAGQGRNWLAQQLQSLGWRVEFHALYERTAVLWSAETARLLAQGSNVVLLITSLESLDAMAESLRHHDLEWPLQLSVVTLHSRIQRRLQCCYAARPGARLQCRLARPDESSLFQAILAARNDFA